MNFFGHFLTLQLEMLVRKLINYNPVRIVLENAQKHKTITVWNNKCRHPHTPPPNPSPNPPPLQCWKMVV